MTQNITLKRGTYYLGCVENDVAFKYTFAPSKRTISSLKNSTSKTMTVQWNKLNGANGYQIQYSTYSSFKAKTTITIKGASTVSKKISSLKKGKTYYVRVRAYSTINSTDYYSKWSAKKSVLIKK